MKNITIIGNLGANAVLHSTDDGSQLMSFNVAVDVTNADPIWFHVVANYRERLFPFLVKGQNVCVIGDLSANIYNNRLRLSISANKMELCGPSPAKAEESSQQ